jgi:hypothetical protein
MEVYVGNERLYVLCLDVYVFEREADFYSFFFSEAILVNFWNETVPLCIVGQVVQK